MQIIIKIRDNGVWRGPTADEFIGTLDYRIAHLAKLETVIQLTDNDGELILATGEWKAYYKTKGKRVICLQELSKLLNVYPTIDSALKELGGHITALETTLP